MDVKVSFVLFLSLIALRSALAEDWPQFHGPRRDNRSTETGLLRQWPEGGPELAWRKEDLGHGFASVAIADGMIYTTGNIAGDAVITAMDLAGEKLWQRKNGPAYKRSHPGTRSTPTVVDGKLYNLSGTGNLICINAKTGSPVWALNMLEKFDGRMITWGISESPLVDGDNVICCPGGKEVFMAALDKDTGLTRWTLHRRRRQAQLCDGCNH
jgi:outer membrane protein assembly factor BamB